MTAVLLVGEEFRTAVVLNIVEGCLFARENIVHHAFAGNVLYLTTREVKESMNLIATQKPQTVHLYISQ